MFGRAKPGCDLKILWSFKLNSQVLGLEVEHFADRRSFDVSTAFLQFINFTLSYTQVYYMLNKNSSTLLLHASAA